MHALKLFLFAAIVFGLCTSAFAYDVRSVKWGMSREEVLKTEILLSKDKAGLTVLDDDPESFTIYSTFAEETALLKYVFVKSKLAAAVFFIDREGTAEFLNAIKQELLADQFELVLNDMAKKTVIVQNKKTEAIVNVRGSRTVIIYVAKQYKDTLKKELQLE